MKIWKLILHFFPKSCLIRNFLLLFFYLSFFQYIFSPTMNNNLLLINTPLLSTIESSEMSTCQSGYCLGSSISVVHQIVFISQKPIPSKYNLIEVHSTFGGAGLYKANASYGCQNSDADKICKHVPFHLSI
jgi:hypothetical protein